MKNHPGTIFPIALSVLMTPTALSAQENCADETAVRGAALDYVQGWYDADGARMRRALHPDLAKRGLVEDALRPITAEALIELTANGMGKSQPGKKEKTITVLDISGSIAAVKIVSDQFVDYLQLGKMKGRWEIINVLWEYRKQ